MTRRSGTDALTTHWVKLIFENMAQADMEAIVDDACATGQYVNRLEGEIVPKGLSLTKTSASEHWYYRKGDMLAMLHVRPSDNHKCFSLNTRIDWADE